MPAQVPIGNGVFVIMLNRAFNDASPPNTVFKNQVAASGTTVAGMEAFALQFGALFAGMTEDQLSTRLLGNLGVLPNTGLQAALKDYIAFVGKANVGLVAVQLGSILSGLENAVGDQAAFRDAAVAWNKEVTDAYTYSSNPAGSAASPQLVGGAALSDASWTLA